MILVICYRKRPAYRVASPLFCLLELTGFLFCYVASIFFVGERNHTNCVVVPVALNIGFSLVMGNLVAKNYRIYRIFNNVFAKQTTIKDMQLLRVSGSLLLLTVLILVIWFGLCDASTEIFPSSHDAYYVGCVYDGASHSVFMALLTALAACELAFATFLAFKTRSIGKTYEKYNECKQIGLSVYNIFFSALIGAVVFFLPATDFYTQHYLTATMIVWATTFCLFALFLPKFAQFVKDCKSRRNKVTGLASNGQPESSQSRLMAMVDSSARGNELISVNGMLNSDRLSTHDSDSHCSDDAYSLQHRQVHHSIMTPHPRSQGHPANSSKILDAFEAQVPVQIAFRYFPYLSAWDMNMVVLIPKASYFSCYSKKSRKGFVFGYTHASVVSRNANENILKIHGLQWHDLWVQVAAAHDLDQWLELFNSHLTPSPSFLRKDEKPLSRPELPLLDSGLTNRCLLDDQSIDASMTTAHTYDDDDTSL
ncbi:hypothetical protein DM01DRAFT_1128526 [Hesseltinella vesiculosa]|uniref:G-protein coupled receptors family 3 profile domain-containing protein n=1 Tax=Hesseltinella vesiculosa TaxID=101127 RepID=A0A1X2GVX6_9FUNG|nr:hypothetical protein DM01DRAFT_1128526 [Hesseltinella vesiculosa]